MTIKEIKKFISEIVQFRMACPIYTYVHCTNTYFLSINVVSESFPTQNHQTIQQKKKLGAFIIDNDDGSKVLTKKIPE